MRLPNLSGKEVIKALSKEGFTAVRQKGSHVILIIHILKIHRSLQIADFHLEQRQYTMDMVM